MNNLTLEEDTEISQIKNRIIGHISGGDDGPVLICVGGIHGNEHAGILALREVFSVLADKDENFKGDFIGIAGNLAALNSNKRFVDKDLNRMFSIDRAQSVLESNQELEAEEKEQRELLTLFNELKERYLTRKIIMLDLHTTSASGGTFTIAMKDELSRRICEKLEVTTIIGLESILKGTTLNYFDEIGFTALGFEAGQHKDPASVSRMKAAIFTVLESIGSYEPMEIKNYHQLLKTLRKDQPSLVKFIYRHQINEGDNFVMKPGYKNFQRIEKGEHLANDKKGPIFAKQDAMILMPLYQPQGDDGFFVVEKAK